MSSPPADDWDLLASVRRDPTALDTLFRRHRDTVFRFAYARLQNEDDANDLTQEVFLRLGSYRRPVFRRARFSTWLYRVTANLAADEWRRRQRVTTVAGNDEEAEAPANPAAAKDLDRVLALLPELPERQRETLVLRILEGWSVAETAAAMGISNGSVKTHLHRALESVRRQLED